MPRRNLQKDQLNYDTFKIFIRFMIVSAENKRVVEYSELTKVFGIPLEDLRDYAGFLGDYCVENKLPFLNSLIINSTEGRPGADFYTWAGDDEQNWGDHVSQCFAEFHLPRNNSVRFQNISGINQSIEEFISG